MYFFRCVRDSIKCVISWGAAPPPDIVGMKTRKKEKEKSEKAMEWKEKGKNGEEKRKKGEKREEL